MGNKTSHYARYGNVYLNRSYCPKCKKEALVSNDEMLCCGTQIEKFRTTRVRNMTEIRNKRKRPSKKRKEELLEQQANKCIYCDFEFGSFISDPKTGRDKMIKVSYDHIEAFCFAYNNRDNNFIASCQICNGIKGSKMFEDFKEVVRYVRKRRKKKGYGEEKSDNL